MADEVIGRADYVLGVDNAGVKKGVSEAEQVITASGAKTEAEYTSSAYRAGVVIGNGIKTGATVVARGAAALFAVATKGVLDLTSVQADYTAETGATAEEAGRAGKAINAMAGRNIQPLAEIGKTAAKVRTDLGLVGDEADRETEAFLRFARATKQDAAGAVVAFDDILDSWGLTAKDAQVIMDKLIVSHQRYGGSIEANQAALAQLAPQLRGLNLTIDDGIGLLNLFASSGLDASAAQTALNSAITKLPKGESLQDFLSRLSQVTDDGQRAQLAMDVFGQKAGAKLANAIRPGVESIDHFKISTQEATGATEKAADALDSTFGARAQLLLNKFGSALRSLGTDWGPLLTGAASAGTLLTTVFGDDLVRKLGPNVVKAFKALGEKGGDALADGISNVTQGAGGTVAGNFIASRIETMVDSTKNSRIAAAIRTGAAKAGALWGVFFAGAQGIASTLYTGVAAAIAKTPAAGAVRAAVLASAIALGTLEGTAIGGAIAVAATAAIAAAPIVLAIAVTYAAGKIVDPGGLKGQLDQITNDVSSGKKVWVDAGSQGGQAYVDAAAGAIDTKLGPAINDGLERTGRAVNPAPLATAVAAVVSSSIARAIPWVKIAREQGNRLSGAVAQGIHDAREKPWQAWQTMLEALSHEQKPAEERAHLLGALVTARLAQGLRSKDPELRAQAVATKQAILDRLAELSPNAHNIGVKGMESLRKAMKSKDVDIRTAALAIYHAATHNLDTLPAKGTAYGQAYGRNLAAGMASYRHEVEQAASLLAGAAGSYHKLSSPAKRGPWSELGGPEGWGRRYAAFLSKGIAAGIPDVNSAIAKGMRFAGFDAPFLNQLVSDPHRPIGRHGPATSSSSVRHGDVTIGAIHLHGVGSDVSQPAAHRFGQSVLDEVSKGFREQGARRGIHPAVIP